MNRVRVKVCGITKADQASSLVALGVDAIGLIFYEKSPRKVSIDKAITIRKCIPAFVDVVGVFVDHSAEQINEVSRQVDLNLVQLHGNQSPEFAAQLSCPYIKVIRVDSKKRIVDEMNLHNNASGFLLDTFSKDTYGGTGHRINADFLPEILPKNIIFSGGINIDNIDTVLLKKPYAIDINSGFEHAPGDKNLKLITTMMEKITTISH